MPMRVVVHKLICCIFPRNLYPDKKEELEQFRAHLLETSNEMAPLKVWQVQELSLQAAERILASSSGEEALKTLTHIAHNFPLQARSLIKTPVRAELKTEIIKNQDLFGATLNLSPSDAAIFVNGMYFDMEIVDVISLLEVLRQELRVMEKLHKIGSCFQCLLLNSEGVCKGNKNSISEPLPSLNLITSELKLCLHLVETLAEGFLCFIINFCKKKCF